MFIEVLFAIVKTWMQPRCPSTEEWIKKLWYIYIYNVILLSNKIEENCAICRDVDGPRDCHTK